MTWEEVEAAIEGMMTDSDHLDGFFDAHLPDCPLARPYLFDHDEGPITCECAAIVHENALRYLGEGFTSEPGGGSISEPLGGFTSDPQKNTIGRTPEGRSHF